MSSFNRKQKGKASRSSGPVPVARFLTGRQNILGPKPGKKGFNFCILGFLIPFICAGLALLIRAIDMQSDSYSVFSILHSDAYYQYYPFLLDFRRNILSGEGLQYTWNIGMGVDYIGLYAYYLGSPLNWLTLLMPESWVLGYYSFMVPVRMGFAGLFFATFLKHTFRRNDLSIALFGSFYGLCAWALGYMWNVMWLDTFALLPLVILGVVKLLRERKFILYTVSLFLSVIINYYIGFFTCIFTFLVFVCYEICRWKNFKKFMTDLGLMALFTFIAIGMTAVITLPTYASLQTTSSSVNEWPTGLQMHIAEEATLKGFWQAFVKVATNTFAAVQPNDKAAATKGGMPNLYCGVFAAGLAFLFVTCKQVKWRDKLCALGMLLLLNCSFIFKQLDYIWHGFHFTNEIPNRFSFIYSFVLLYMAYRAWLFRKKFRPWQILSAIAFLIICMFLSPGYTAYREAVEDMGGGLFSGAMSQNPENFNLTVLFAFLNILFIILYLGCMLLSVRIKPAPRTKWRAKRIWYRNLRMRRNVSAVIFVAVMAIELIVTASHFGTYVNTTNLYGYPRGGEDSEKMIQYMKDREDENAFYRAEAAQHQTYNDGALNDYNGLSIFSSSANVNVTNYVRAWGLSGYKTYNRFAYEEAPPLLHMFTNIKYVIERQNYVEPNPYLTDIQSSGKVHLMENNYYLPVGFVTDPALAEVSFTDQNGSFQFQNELLSAALGREVQPWKELHQGQYAISSNDSVSLSGVTGASCSYSPSSSAGRIYYTYTIEDEGLFAIRYYMPGKNKFTVSYKPAGSDKFTTLHKDSHNGLAYISSICQVYPGDEIQVTVESGTSSNKLRLNGAILNQAVVDEIYAQLSQSQLNVTRFDQTLIEGTIDCKQAGLMYTSIPQTGDNWHIYVDGQEAEITLIGDAMLGVMLPEGQHQITIRYQNSVLRNGAFISIFSIILFYVIIGYVYIYLKKKKGKYSACQDS